jgi:hypothetical protein
MHKTRQLNLTSSISVSGRGSRYRNSTCEEYARNEMRRQTLGMAKFLMSNSAIDFPSPSFGIIDLDDEIAAMTTIPHRLKGLGWLGTWCQGLPSLTRDASCSYLLQRGESLTCMFLESIDIHQYHRINISSSSLLSLTTAIAVAVLLSFHLYS